MRRRPTISPTSPLRIWSRRLPSLAAAAILALGTSQAGAQQAKLGTPEPMGTFLPPVNPTTPVPTTLPPLPNPGGSALLPSSLQSRQAAAARPKVAEQRIQTEPIIPPGGAPQPTMAELRQSLRDDGLKNMGMPDFTRAIGAKPPTPPARMMPATPPSTWSRLFSWTPTTTPDSATSAAMAPATRTVLTPSMTENAPAPRTEPPVVQQTNGTTPPATQSSSWPRLFSRTPSTTAPLPPSMTENAPAPRVEPPVVQQTSGTAPPPEQQSWWYRLTHRTTPSDNAGPQPAGPMVLPEAAPLRIQ
ncbi:MAG TPA: hypothetical protein VHR72_14475 [Gemmataceae bacterium]|jgi:hypothetical protein|nr:hypothetical protein [Gemmataceae bacterium]